MSPPHSTEPPTKLMRRLGLTEQDLVDRPDGIRRKCYGEHHWYTRFPTGHEYYMTPTGHGIKVVYGRETEVRLDPHRVRDGYVDKLSETIHFFNNYDYVRLEQYSFSTSLYIHIGPNPRFHGSYVSEMYQFSLTIYIHNGHFERNQLYDDVWPELLEVDEEALGTRHHLRDELTSPRSTAAPRTPTYASLPPSRIKRDSTTNAEPDIKIIETDFDRPYSRRQVELKVRTPTSNRQRLEPYPTPPSSSKKQQHIGSLDRRRNDLRNQFAICKQAIDSRRRRSAAKASMSEVEANDLMEEEVMDLTEV